MPVTELKTFGNIRDAAIARVKGDAGDTVTVDFFTESINPRYRNICSRKKWKFLRVTNRSIRLPIRYTTGTITITNGSRTITGALTVWTANHRHWWIRPAGTDNSYRVIAVTSATSLTIDSEIVETTAAAITYTLYQSDLALFPDCEDVDDIRIDGTPWQIRPKGPSELNGLRQFYPTKDGRPQFYSIEGQSVWPGTNLGAFILGYDFLGTGLTKGIHFWPQIPDANYTVHIPYKRIVDPLSLTTDEPLIPKDHRHILLWFSLADWYMKDRQDQTGRYYESLAKDELRELETKFLDSDDVLEFQAPDDRQFSPSYLRRHSQYYFDREG